LAVPLPATLASGLGLLAFGHLLAPLFAVPAAALWAVGAFFLPFASWIWIISRRPQLRRGEAALAGVLDGTYALASFDSRRIRSARWRCVRANRRGDRIPRRLSRRTCGPARR